MTNKIFIITLLFSHFLFSQKQNLPQSTPVTEQYFGENVTDEYRNLEDFSNSSVQKWMQGQTDYTKSVLNRIPNWNYYLNLRTELDKKQQYSVSDLRIAGNDKYFYLKRNAGEKNAKVYFREVDFNSSTKDTSNLSHEYVVNLISPSWDGSKLAISLSEKGKEFSDVIIMDISTKSIYPKIINQLNPSVIGGIKWLEDNSGFFYVYYPDTNVKSPSFAKNTQTVLYRIGEDPKKRNVVFSNSNNPDLNISKEVYPSILVFNPDDKYYIGILIDAEDYRRTFIIDKKDLLTGKKKWKTLYEKDSKVFNLRIIDDEIYFLSAYNTPNYKLCKTDLKNPNFKTPGRYW